MAATLMEIKSAMLLPKPPVAQGTAQTAAAELTDPRYELVQKLLEYKKFKDTATLLDHKQHRARQPLPPLPRRSARTKATTSPRPSTWTRSRSGTCSTPSTA